MNIMDARVVRQDGQVHLRVSDEISIDVTPFADQLQEEEYLVGVRAYNLHTHTDREGMIPFQATLELSEELGSDTELHLRHGQIQFVMLMQEVVRYPLGTNIKVYMDPSRLFLYSKQTRSLVLKTFSEE
jgi:glycerol transport system ATP-binding protein